MYTTHHKNTLNSFGTLKRAFPRMKQAVYPNERSNVVHGQHLHFTQIPMHEEMFQEMGLIKGFYVTIRFEEGFKDFCRNKVKIAWFATLETKMLVTMDVTLVVAWVASCLSWWLLDPGWSLTLELCEFLYWLVMHHALLIVWGLHWRWKFGPTVVEAIYEGMEISVLANVMNIFKCKCQCAKHFIYVIAKKLTLIFLIFASNSILFIGIQALCIFLRKSRDANLQSFKTQYCKLTLQMTT